LTRTSAWSHGPGRGGFAAPPRAADGRIPTAAAVMVAGWSGARTCDGTEAIESANAQLVAILETQAQEIDRLSAALAAHPSRSFAEHADPVLAALCRFERARQMRTAGPILNASERLVGDRIHTWLAPVVENSSPPSCASSGTSSRFWCPRQGRKIILGGTGPARPVPPADAGSRSQPRCAGSGVTRPPPIKDRPVVRVRDLSIPGRVTFLRWRKRRYWCEERERTFTEPHSALPSRQRRRMCGRRPRSSRSTPRRVTATRCGRRSPTLGASATAYHARHRLLKASERLNARERQRLSATCSLVIRSSLRRGNQRGVR
jgi:hypothetical protein